MITGPAPHSTESKGGQAHDHGRSRPRDNNKPMITMRGRLVLAPDSGLIIRFY
jgi:hypothetical protein